MDVGVKIESSEKVRLLLEITERLDYSELTATYDRLPREKEDSIVGRCCKLCHAIKATSSNTTELCTASNVSLPHVNGT